jgi:hypothetical protein
MMEILQNHAGTIITIISFIYAIYTNRRHAKLVDFNREHAWEIYRLSDKVLNRFQTLQIGNTDKTQLLTNINKGEEAAQELLLDTIRMIKRFEKKFNSETIDNWFKNKKIPNESHVEAFKKYT